MSDKAFRRERDKRQKTVIKFLRFTPNEIEEIEQKAEAVGQRLSAYIRNVVMNRKVTSAIDGSFMKELLGLGDSKSIFLLLGSEWGIRILYGPCSNNRTAHQAQKKMISSD